MYKYWEWIQLNAFKTYFVIVLMNLIGNVIGGPIVMIISEVLWFASWFLLVSYGISLFSIGDIYKSSDNYNKWELRVKAGFCLILGICLGIIWILSFISKLGLIK